MRSRASGRRDRRLRGLVPVPVPVPVPLAWAVAACSFVAVRVFVAGRALVAARVSVATRAGACRSTGAVTAEFAVLMPVLVVILSLTLAAGAAGVAKLRCIDAARSAARLAARHESSSTALTAARSAAPDHASIRLAAGGDLVRVEVTAQVPLPLPGRPTVEVGATSVAMLEPNALGAIAGGING